MERLTTDNPQNNTENALNLAYAKDRWVHIRGMDEPFTDYIKKECRRNGCNLSEMSEHEICDCVTECAFINPECPIFLLFMVATQAAELRARLAAYEDTGLTPEEIQEAADRRHNCKIECLLKRYNELSEETAALRAQLQEQDNEPLECRKYQCLECGHEWLEDCDASDYPDYCPVCGTCLLPQAEDDSNNTMMEREVRSTYGETWLAYRRKPESVDHHET